MFCRLCGTNKGQRIRAKYVFGGTQEHKFYECKKCGVIYLYPYLTEEEETRFYKMEFEKFMATRVGNHRDWSNAQKHIATNQDQVQRRMKYLQNYIDAKIGGNLLEIGCSSGFMLEAFRQKGFKCFGVEPSGEFLEFLHKNNFNAYENLDDLISNNLELKFDVITHFFVFEHIADPYVFLTKTYSLLKDDGIIIAEIPSSTDALTSLYNIHAFEKFYWSIAHHYYYNPISIAYLMDRLGFKYEIIPEQRYDLSNHITWLMDGKPGGQSRFCEFSKQTIKSYADDLKKSWKCDTLILVIYKGKNKCQK